MGIQHFKATDICPESESAVKVNDALTVSTVDRQIPPAVGGAPRLLPCVFVVKKAKPYTYTSFGASACYVIEGEITAEDQSTGISITLTKGDVTLVNETTVIKVSSPSNARLFAVDLVGGSSVLTDGCS